MHDVHDELTMSYHKLTKSHHSGFGWGRGWGGVLLPLKGLLMFALKRNNNEK